MKRMLYVAFAALVLAIPATSSATADATVNVRITQGAFAPASVTINAGDTVTWTNNTNGMHQVVSDDGVFVSPGVEGRPVLLVHLQGRREVRATTTRFIPR